jgi:RNA polymerase sigma factor (sigma-70 family)
MDKKAREVARLWTLAQPVVSSYVASLVRDFRDRDDVLQDVAVAVLDSFGNYDPARPFAAWAIGLARNQVLLYLRRKGCDTRRSPNSLPRYPRGKDEGEGQRKMKLSTLVFLAMTMGAFASTSTAQSPGSGSPRPNLVFILGEGHGWSSTSVQMDDDVAQSKSTFTRTPNFARLAREGTRFARFLHHHLAARRHAQPISRV